MGAMQSSGKRASARVAMRGIQQQSTAAAVSSGHGTCSHERLLAALSIKLLH